MKFPFAPPPAIKSVLGRAAIYLSIAILTKVQIALTAGTKMEWTPILVAALIDVLNTFYSFKDHSLADTQSQEDSP